MVLHPHAITLAVFSLTRRSSLIRKHKSNKPRMITTRLFITCKHTQGPFSETPVLQVPGTSYTMQLQDSLVLREKIVEDFAKHCRHILSEAIKWAPATTASHLQVFFVCWSLFMRSCAAWREVPSLSIWNISLSTCSVRFSTLWFCRCCQRFVSLWSVTYVAT